MLGIQLFLCKDNANLEQKIMKDEIFLVNFAEIQPILLKDIEIATNILTLLYSFSAVCLFSIVQIEYC